MKTILILSIIVMSLVLLTLGAATFIMALQLKFAMTGILALSTFGAYELCGKLDNLHHSI